jgi:aminoglycoside N3'-acetyltransferase
MIEIIKKSIKELLKDNDKPIVVYSAIWPFLKLANMPPRDFCEELINILVQTADNRYSVFMPAFTGGFNNGVCNLDAEKSLTGALTEEFRQRKDVRRTVSAFFSFGVYGKDAEEAISLKPKNAWGEGSLYEWFEINDAQIITIGTHLTHCSFTHRAEWLMKHLINYRYVKELQGNIIHEGKQFELKETLFVRNLNPSPVNDWTWAVNDFVNNGMKIISIDGIQISRMSAKKKLDILVPMIEKDPLVLLKNKNDFKQLVVE